MAVDPRAAARPAAAPRRPELDDYEHDAWRRLILQRCGLEFGETRKAYLARRLWQRMALHGDMGYGTYRDRVQRQPDEWCELLELLINRETSFFRHQPSFEALRIVLQDTIRSRSASLADQSSGVVHLDLWSAGCSTGQEPYSLAMCAFDAAATSRNPVQVRITGGDISERAREMAREGLYSERQMAVVPSAARRLYFQRETGSRGPMFRVGKALRDSLSLLPWNLARTDTYPHHSVDVVFCQNLLIYLPRDRREAIVRRLGECLRPGGHLFLAPGEVLGLRAPGLEPVGFADCLVYRRTA